MLRETVIYLQSEITGQSIGSLKRINLKKAILILLGCLAFFTMSCAIFPFHSKQRNEVKIVLTRVTIELNPLVKDLEGNPFLKNDESIKKYAEEVFQSCS